MENTVVAYGEKLTLPECTFTPPEDMIFDRWDLGAVGDKVAITADTTLKALWKDIPYLLGDVDGDGEVTIFDATAIQRYLANLHNKAFHERPADADGDGEVSIFDATAIQRYLASIDNPSGISEKTV